MAGKTQRTLIAVEHDEDQEVQTYVTQSTDGGSKLNGGFIQVFRRLVRKKIYAKLPLCAKVIVLPLFELADYQNQFIIRDTSYRDIAALAGCSVSSSRRGIESLINSRLIVILSPGGITKSGRLLKTTYQMLLPVDAPGANEMLNRHSVQPLPPGKVPYARIEQVPVLSENIGPVLTEHSPCSHRTLDHAPPEHGSMPPKSKYLQNEDLNSIRDHAAAELVKRGVGDPNLSLILSGVAPASILEYIVDFDIRNSHKGKPPKSAGWLATAILRRYELHRETRSKFDKDKKIAITAKNNRIMKQLEERAAAELAEKGKVIDAEFDDLSDADLAKWKETALVEYAGPMTRGLGDASPRTEPRLQRLIKALMSRSYA